MTSPFLQDLITRSQETNPLAGYAPPTLSFEPEDEGLASYLGNLTRLGIEVIKPSNIFRQPVGNGMFRLFTDNEENLIKQKISDAYTNTLDYITSPNFLERAGQDVSEGFRNMANGFNSLIEEEEKSKMIGGMVRGLLQSTIQQPLTLLSGKTIVDGEVVDATSPEMVGALYDTAGLAAGIGAYNKISSLAKATPSITPGVATTRVSRVGTLAKNIGREYAAQVGSTVAYEAVANPDEFDFDAITNAIGNPLVLAGAGFGGGLRTRSANARARAGWLENNGAINADATVALPSAKQIAVGPGSTLADAAASVDALAVSENWIEAGINKLKQAGKGTFYFILDTPEQVKTIVDRYLGEPLVVKPTPNRPVTNLASPGGIVYYFANDFDNLVFQTDDLAALATEYNVPKNTLVELKGRLVDAAKKAKTEQTTYGKSIFRYKNVPELPFQPPKVKPRAYAGPNNTLLLTMNPMTQEMINTFTSSGMLVGQDALINGTLGTFQGVAKNGKLKFRLRNGRVASATLDDVTRIPGADAPAWNRRTFTESLVDDFLAFADGARRNETFDQLLSRFGAIRKFDPQVELPAFTNLVYKTLQARAESANFIGPKTFAQFDDVAKFERMATELVGDAEKARGLALDKLSTLGYRVVVDGPGYKVINMDGRLVGKFSTVDELVQLAGSDFTSPNAPVLNVSSMPLDGVPTVNSRWNSLSMLIDEAKASKIGQFFRRPDRLAEDLLRTVGDATLGTEIGFKVNNLLNGIDAATNGIFKPLVKRAEQIAIIGRKVTRDVKEQVTRALEQKSLAELAAGMNQEQIVAAEALNVYFQQAGGSEVVKAAFNKLRDGKIKIESLDPNVRQAVVKLQEAITNELITDERVLRYVDALESGINMTAEELIATYKWDRNARMLYDESKKFFEEASSRFNIPRVITGYAPWITKWESIPNLYTKVVNEGDFIHELQRLGVTESSRRITDINELVYRYLKTGIHYKAPIAGGGTAGELLSEINSLIRQAQELGADVRPLQQWVQNIRGVPTVEQSIETNFQRIVNDIKGGLRKSGINTDDVMDAISLTKLGLRPINGLRDMVTGYGIALLYGREAANQIFIRTPQRLARINQLIGEGYLPQTDIDAFLSRTGRGKLSKATDISMKASLQPQTYKIIAGNMYVYTYDKAIDVLTKAKGDARYVINELGDLLDGGTKASQDYFLRTATRDPVTAARFLASRNAYNVANKFGRLNNPLAWQGTYGRIWGQFGSWGLNALTAINESLINSRSKQAMMNKFTRLAAFDAIVLGAGAATGLNLYNFIVNPVSMVPTGGPALDMFEDTVLGLRHMMSPDENTREFGRRMLRDAPGGIPFYEDMMKGYESWSESESFFRSAGQALGFDFLEEQ